MSAPSPIPDEGSQDPGELVRHIHDLEQRVLRLEKHLGISAAAAGVSAPLPAPAPLDLPPNVVPVLGRTLVAIAGAYVLRALTDWGLLPAAAGVALGLVYALFWLWFATCAPAKAKFAAALSCSTSVLIMAPLLWEATGRLGVLSSGTGAGILAAFALIALVLGQGTPHRAIATIAGASSIVMAFALLLVRRDIVPFTVALLVIAAAMEAAAWLGRPPGGRLFAAFAAISGVLVFSDLMSSPRGMPETWVPASPEALLSAQVTLALLYIATAFVQTVVRRQTLSFPEMAQTAAALLSGIGCAVWVFGARRGVMLSLGAAALAGGVACYAISFRLFERDHKWNFRAWATFGLFLVLAGTYLPFSGTGFQFLACVLAVASCWTARAYQLPTLGLHGAVFLVLGSAAGGGTRLPLAVLFAGGYGPGPAPWPACIAVLLAAVLCWAAIAGSSAGVAGRWRNQISSLAIAAHIVWIVAGLAVYATLALWRSATGAPRAAAFPADTLGTVVLTALSLALAWAGTRWNRRELIWLLYGFMALGAYKLAARDFMNEHNIALVVSLLCYGGALIQLPRMLRGGTPVAAE